MYKSDNSIKVLFCGGGTGGHLYPAIALCEELETRFEHDKLDVLYIGTKQGLESRVLPKLDYKLKTIWIKGFQRGRSLRNYWLNLFTPLRLLISFFQCYYYLKRFKPDIAIGTGGYAAGPPLYIANKMKIPIFLQEPNVFPGATIRMLAKKAEKIYIAYKDTGKYFENTKCLGTPLRRSLKKSPKDQALNFFGLHWGKNTIFIFGGSQGSQALNEFIMENLKNIINSTDCQVIWQTGQREYKKISNYFNNLHDVYITPFIHEMDIAYSAADIVVSRAGALTVSELCLYGKPSMLIPLPTAAENHQEKNARTLEKADAALVIIQNYLTLDLFLKKLLSVINHKEKIAQMSKNAKTLTNPDSAKLIVDDILEYVEENVWES